MKKYLLLALAALFLPFVSHATDAEGGDLPVAGFTYYIEFVGISADVSFFNTSVDADTYFWDLGDGTTSEEMHPFHNYALPGIYIVCLTAENELGSDTWCDTIITYYAPSADFTYSGDPDVIFTDLTSNYPTEWYWNFGDGESSTLQNPEHTYAANGIYDVCLTATNPGGTNYTCKTLEIATYISTEAAFTYAGDPVVSFHDESTNSPAAWYWDFGDLSNSSEQHPEHAFTANGLFTVCLTATNAGGSDTYCEAVLISNYYVVPIADFMVNNISGNLFSFTDNSLNSPSEWLWDFADGETSNEQNPEHEFPSDGNFNVCLTATNADGSDTTCKYVLLTDLKNISTDADIQIYPNPASDNISIKFSGFTSDELNIELMNYTGAQVDIKFIKNDKAEWMADISKLPAGYYLLTISGNDLSMSTGIIIQ